MAKPGRKPDTPAMKVARGTLDPSPSILAQMQTDPADVPQKDDELGDLESEIWDASIEHFVANGATAADSLLLNDMVNMVAEIVQRRRLFIAGEDIDPPSVTSLVELYVDGVSRWLNSASQGGGSFANAPLYVGRRGGSSLAYSGYITGLCIIPLIDARIRRLAESTLLALNKGLPA